MKMVLLLISILALCSHVVAEQPEWSNLHFSSTTIDFGHIPEDGGSVVRHFEATNIGNSTIHVTNVVSSCGCTTVEYSREGIAPNEEFMLEVRFNPFNRPGRFERSIWVETTESEEAIELNLIGYVLPRQRTTEELYPFDLGYGMRIAANFHAFGYIEHGKSVEHRIGYTNNSDQELTIGIKQHDASGALNIAMPTVIAPHTSGDITLTYSLNEDSHSYGSLNDTILLTINGIEANYTLSTNAIAVDNFDLIDDISAPKAEIQKNIIKFGDVNCSSGVLELSTTLSNTGQESLVVRAVELTSEAVECSLAAGTTIEAGREVTITIRLTPSLIEDRDNPFTARLRLTTNDPMMPMRTIRITALPL